MKIIKKGSLPEQQVYQETCRHCDTVYEFARIEAEYISNQRVGDALKTKCPVCKRDVWTPISAYKKATP